MSIGINKLKILKQKGNGMKVLQYRVLLRKEPEEIKI